MLILQAALEPFLTALDLFVLTWALQSEQGARPVRFLLAGAALGLHALNRPNMLIVLVGLAILFVARIAFQMYSSADWFPNPRGRRS